MHRLPFLAQRLFNKPHCVAVAKAEVIVAALADRFGVTHLFNGELRALSPYDPEDEFAPDDRAYGVLAGVAVIPVYGTLVAKLGSLRPFSGMTGYDGIRSNFLQALGDQDVRAIVLDIDSPGGEAAGMFDLSDLIYGARGVKPLHAILNEDAYSAAYALASSTDRITVPRTGGTGSVGAVLMHAEMSQAMSKQGITVTVVRSGDRKAEANTMEPLNPVALAGLQQDVDVIGGMFVDMVARNRGLSVDVVRATDAATYLGQAGVAVGFADAVMAPDAAFLALLESL